MERLAQALLVVFDEVGDLSDLLLAECDGICPARLERAPGGFEDLAPCGLRQQADRRLQRTTGPGEYPQSAYMSTSTSQETIVAGFRGTPVEGE